MLLPEVSCCLLLLAATVCAGGMKTGAGRIGGPCAYHDYPGTATITRVEKTDASREQGTASSGPGYEGYEVWFRFVTEQPVAEEWAREGMAREHLFQLANSWYPGDRYLRRYGLAAGKSYRCVLKVIVSGTCTPTVFDFPELKRDDYFELAR